MREARYKILVIGEQDILFFLNFHRKAPDCFSLTAPGQLPADAVVTAVTYSISHRGFLCRVWSSEFDIVPDGQEVPLMDPPLFEVHNMRDYRLVPVQRPESQVLSEHYLEIDGVEVRCFLTPSGEYIAKESVGPFKNGEIVALAFPPESLQIPAECQQVARSPEMYGCIPPLPAALKRRAREALEEALRPVNNRVELTPEESERAACVHEFTQSEQDKMTDFFFGK